MQNRSVVLRCAMQLAQRANCRPCERQPRRNLPRGVRSPLLDRGSHRIDDGEELDLARVPGRGLIGIEHAGCPVVPLQTVQRFVLPPRADFGVLLVAGRQVVEMQDHPVLSGGMNACVGAVEALRLWAPAFQVDIASESPQRPVEGDADLRSELATQRRDALRAQPRLGLESHRLLPLVQCAEPHTAHEHSG